MTRPTSVEISEAMRIAGARAERELGERAWEGRSAEDVVQEVMLRFAALDLDEVGNWRAWVETTTRNACFDIRRRERRRNVHPDHVADVARRIAGWVLGPSAQAMAPRLAVFVLEGLSEREQAILLRHAAGASNEEIAAEFGYATPRSAAVAISRARKKVRDRFDEAGRAEILDPQRPY
jgi:RNA polymerase sigma factor (sigma-70 family)